MKRTVCLLALLATLPQPRAAFGAQLFQVVDGKDKAAALSPASSPAVVEQREIAVDLSLLLSKAAGSIELTLLDGETYEVVRTGLEEGAGGGYTWSGKLRRPDGYSDDVVFSVSGTAMSGLIYAPGTVYEIIPREGGRHVLAKLDQSLFPECAGEVAHDEPPVVSGPAEPEAPIVPADSEAQIDVLVVYTAAARAAAGGASGMLATIQGAVAAANTSYANSQISTRLRLVHTAEVAYNESAATFSSHLQWLNTNAGVAALRNTYGADLVDMLVEDGESCGIGYLLGGSSSVTHLSCAVGNLSFAHELGHNMGCTHNPEDGSGGAFAYSYGHWNATGGFRTVMSYAPSGCPTCIRRSFFSNPNLTYLGLPTGIANQRDNARTINSTDQQVANYRQAVNNGTFADVPATYWAFPFIESVYAAGVTGGCASNPLRFCPGSLVTRDQMAVFLGVAKHGAGFVPDPATGVFTDVATGPGIPAFIEQAYRDGLTAGCTTNPRRYCPGSVITRDQMAVFLLISKNGAAWRPNPAIGLFSDVPITSPIAPWVEALYLQGITGGCSTVPLRYCPSNSVTRAEMAVFLVTAFGLPMP
jgi:hypothetical protein